MLPKIFGGFMRDTNCNFFHNVVSFGYTNGLESVGLAGQRFGRLAL